VSDRESADGTLLLEVRGLKVRYGVIEALHGIDVSVCRGEIVTVIGANGAGKTTLLKAISGLVPAAQGALAYDGAKDLCRLKAHQIVALGISHVPEGRRIFQNLTVRENLDLGAYLRRDPHAVERGFAEVFTLFPRLKERLGQNAGTLSGGEQQMLAIGRALMANPKLLLLDEPSLGLAPLVTREFFARLSEINQLDGLSILVVEQNASLALGIGHWAYVLETGRIVVENEATKLQDDDSVRKAYLGF
jgi:branched-chain amino acid transport system ATP-binding protein